MHMEITTTFVVLHDAFTSWCVWLGGECGGGARALTRHGLVLRSSPERKWDLKKKKVQILQSYKAERRVVIGGCSSM